MSNYQTGAFYVSGEPISDFSLIDIKQVNTMLIDLSQKYHNKVLRLDITSEGSFGIIDHYYFKNGKEIPKQEALMIDRLAENNIEAEEDKER